MPLVTREKCVSAEPVVGLLLFLLHSLPQTFSVVCGGHTALDLRTPTSLAEIGWFGTADSLTHLGSS